MVQMIAHLSIRNLSVSFPIYQSGSRSLRSALISQAVGGTLHGSDKLVEVKALCNINLEINGGDRLALIGHNGAGKSTFLRVLARVYPPSSGELIAHGKTAPLFDIHLGLDEEATGYENILLRGLLLGQTRAQMHARIDEIAEFSGLGSFLNLPVRTYSSGMTLRLLFSIATCIEADIILMDEWIATGDQAFLAKANARLRQLISQSKVFVLASHNAELLRNLCNRAIVLEKGHVTFDGPVDEALGRYCATLAA
jgi:ABC-type polysaccharide/polyol phosphate transport system ATPase subunit